MVSSILGTRGAQRSPLGRPLPLAVAPTGKRSPGCFEAVSRVRLFAYLKGTRRFLSGVATVSTPSPGCHGRGQIPLLRLLQVSHCFSFIEIYLIDIRGRKQTCEGPFRAPSDPPYSGGVKYENLRSRPFAQFICPTPSEMCFNAYSEGDGTALAFPGSLFPPREVWTHLG